MGVEMGESLQINSASQYIRTFDMKMVWGQLSHNSCYIATMTLLLVNSGKECGMVESVVRLERCS